MLKRSDLDSTSVIGQIVPSYSYWGEVEAVSIL